MQRGKTQFTRTPFFLFVLVLLLYSANPDSGFSGAVVNSPGSYGNHIQNGGVSHHTIGSRWTTFRITTEKDIRKQEKGLESTISEQIPVPPEGYRLWKKTEAKLTAYDPSYRSCGKYADGETSTGENAWKMDGVAVDPSVIPYGTLIWIPEIGFRIADDTGIAMRESWEHKRQVHIDIRMTYHYQARNWGVKNKTVILFRPANPTD